MAWRNILVLNPAKLSLAKNNLKVSGKAEQNITSFTTPLEDIACIVLDSPQITITSALLAKLAEFNITTISCGFNHHPNGVFLPFSNHSKQTAINFEQIAWSEAFKKRIWQHLIKAKLLNQGLVLKKLEKDYQVAEIIISLAKQVKSGDPENHEAVAAKAYFTALVNDNFSREQNNLINSCLNYGYAIIRANIAKNVAAYGFIPALGVKHCNTFNAFNLVDDLIEPFRPILDYFIISQIINYQFDLTLDLTTELKQKILTILEFDLKMNNKKYALLKALEKIVISLRQASNQNNSRLLELPILDGITKHIYE